jgi:xanthine/uracil/vitamin C permease (AzgA family)
MLAATMGCTPIIVYVEAAAGIAEGGKNWTDCDRNRSAIFYLSIFRATICEYTS